MLRILGSSKRLCNGITRRESLIAGGLGLAGLTLADFLMAAPRPHGGGEPHFGQAKSCILLFLYGSPSQLEFADPKPDAPVEIRGELSTIPTTLPGCGVCELLPQTSRVMDRVTVVRSMTHPYPIHGVAYATTGVPAIDVPMELNPHDNRHWPYIGSVVSFLERQNDPKSKRKTVPDNIFLPWPMSSQRVGEVPRAGPYAAYLGRAYNPHVAQFVGKANRKITKTLTDKTMEFDEPYVGVENDCRFTLGDATALPAEITLDRLDRRKSLLEQMEYAQRASEKLAAQEHDRYRQSAYAMIGNNRIRDALDVRRENPRTRHQYGMTLFGQSCLAARRLVEAGSRFVTCFWDEFGLAGSGWDTHWNHYPRMKEELMPGFDRAFSGLIADLDERGMLDETLVVVMSEHGRTPKINAAKGGGRDHWSQAYTILMAGGGVARGRVVGKTDKIGGTVTDSPFSPKDLLATIYHLLGYDLESTLSDKLARPQPIVPGGTVMKPVLA